MTRDTIETVLLKSVKADAVLGKLPEIKKGKLKPVTAASVMERVSIKCAAFDNKDWQHSFAYVYVYCPLVDYNDNEVVYKRENTVRTSALESAARSLFRKMTFLKINGEALYYQLDQLTVEDEEETFSTVITVKLRVVNENFKN